jgi:RHH-type rel operon transcriptional repressor/antitoxin RelB
VRVSETLSVRLPESISKLLAEIAKDTERSKSFHVQKALEAYLQDQADLQVALDRLRDRSDETISLEELKRDLEL